MSPESLVGRAVRVTLTCALVALASLVGTGSAAAEPAKKSAGVLEVLRDYTQLPVQAQAPIVFHTWTEDQKARAGEFSRLGSVADVATGVISQRVRIAPTFPWGAREEYRALTIGGSFLRPDADAVRLRVKAMDGKFRLAIGSPTVYFGHSDVLSEVREITKTDDWQTVEFSLQEDLRRNFRRARFGAKSPVIHYARWIQEPLYLYVARGSVGELQIERVELVGQGQGRPFPTFRDTDIERVATVLDFEDESDMAQAFTFFQEPIDFAKPPYTPRRDWRPPKLERVKLAEGDRPPGGAGAFALRMEQTGTEEVCFAGVKASGVAEANALRLTLRAEHGQQPEHVTLDFLAFVAKPDQRGRFPWTRFMPPESWRNDPQAFTYYLGQDATRGTDYGFYHTRRTVPNARGTELVLPFADFVCAFGQGDCEPWFQSQTPLAGETIMALGFVSPFGQNRAATTVLIDRIEFVRVPGTPDALRSYVQPRTK